MGYTLQNTHHTKTITMNTYLKPSEQLQKELDNRLKEKPYFFIGQDVNARNTTTYLTSMTNDEVIRALTYALKKYTEKQHTDNPSQQS
jgi:hypothetical protein